MHNITETDNIFTVREPAWHGLGAVLPDYPTRQEAQSIAHPWEPVSEPVYRNVPHIDGDNLTSTFDPVPGQMLLARSDNGDPLGVVSDTYQPITNGEMYDVAEAIEGEARGTVRYETGGSLKGGRKVWLLVAMREPLMVPGDPHGAVVPYFALQNAHDGSGSFRGQATMTRIVCDNTAQAADLDAKMRGTSFTFRHSKNVKDRIEQAKEALAGWRHSIEEYSLLSEHLVNVPASAEQRTAFIERFMPLPEADIISERVRANIEDSRAEWMKVLRSVTCEGIDSTAYGLVQASIEHAQHVRRAHSRESLFKRAYLDDSALTRHAMTIAQEVCGA